MAVFALTEKPQIMSSLLVLDGCSSIAIARIPWFGDGASVGEHEVFLTNFQKRATI